MKLRQWLPLVAALPALTYCSADSNGTNNAAGASGTGEQQPDGGGSGAHEGGTTSDTPTGGATDLGGTAPLGGATDFGGTAPLGGATDLGGTAPLGGATDLGGTAALGGATDLGGTAALGGAADLGGAGGSDTGAGPLTYFDYFHDGQSIRWLSNAGSGKVLDLEAPPPTFRFAEGDLDLLGKVTGRRSSVLYLNGGMLYRLDGSAYANRPPKPRRVSSLSGVSDICFSQVISDLSDRSKSLLLFQYKTSGSCIGIGLDGTLPLVAVALTGDAQSPATVLDQHVRALVGPSGKLADTLAITADQRLIRVNSLSDMSEQQVLTTGAYEVEALNLGGTRFLLLVTRGDNTSELYVYDASSHLLSSTLGKFSALSYAPTGLVQNDTFAYFVGTPAASNQNHIYRLPVNGTAPPNELAGIAPTTPSVTVVGLASGKLIYRQTSPLAPGIYALAYDANFATPPTPSVILSGNFYPALLSETRLFYQNGNLAKVINLDASHDEYYSLDGNLSYWIGCTRDGAKDYPASRQQSGNCQRVYVAGLGAGLTGGKLASYDADADAGNDFFANAAREAQQHGQFPEELLQQPLLVDASKSGYNAFQVPSYGLVTGGFAVSPSINEGFRSGLFYLANPSSGPSAATFLAPTGSSAVWLSRGP